jgi:RNA polymerase-binding transcription factor DksA
MTLLSNRAKVDIRQTDKAEPDGALNRARKDNPAARTATPPLDTLRTLASRLQAQIDRGVAEDDPEARALLGTVRRRLAQANEALARIEQGKYGVCADCDRPIENDRLVLQPVATRCTSCQSKAEWRGIA